MLPLLPHTRPQWFLGVFGLILAVEHAPAQWAFQAAASAADLRLEFGILLLAAAAHSCCISVDRLVRQRAPRLVSCRAGIGWLLSLGALEVAPGVAFLQVEPSSALLWGAPLHILTAAVCFALALSSPASASAARLSSLSAALLCLFGLFWNLHQSNGAASWGWDWIELAPLLLLSGGLTTAHCWARTYAPSALLAYLALLQVSRAALLTSLHHLAPPAVVGVFTETLVSPLAQYPRVITPLGLYLGWVVFSYLPARHQQPGLLVLQPRKAAERSQPKARPGFSRLAWLHLNLSGLAALALKPAWGEIAAPGFLSLLVYCTLSSCQAPRGGIGRQAPGLRC